MGTMQEVTGSIAKQSELKNSAGFVSH